MELEKELKIILEGAGAQLCGYGNMTGVENCSFPTGVAVAIPVPVNIIRDLHDGPTKEYCEMYHEWNHRLDYIVTKGAEFLRKKGYEACAQTTDVVSISAGQRTRVPHKTVATRAGLGWIGKSCLLVTKEYGSAVRISSILTNAPLNFDEPFDKSLCGKCDICVESCPAKALKNTLWQKGTKRSEIMEQEKCNDKMRDIMKERTGVEQDLCGKCFAVCAYTQRYLKKKLWGQ